MDWSSSLVAAFACAVFGGVTGWWVPRIIARLPEPGPVADDVDDAPAATVTKPLYVDLAASAGLAPRTAAWSALAAGVIGLALGWTWSLVYLLALVPLGVALGYIDWRIRLLPTKLIAPCYAVAVVGMLVASTITGDVDALIGAAVGWAVTGAVFVLLWLLSKGMGYGDVRLSGVLGLALGYLGWGELLLGIYGGFILGAVGWIPMRALGITQDRELPFGPFMLVGSLVGILWGENLAAFLAG